MAAPSSSGVTVAGSAVATSRPRRITAIESESPISSSRSALISSTASPAARAFRSSSQMPAWAPTSTPRVGCDAMSSTGSPDSSRPTTSFCWFPPESAAAGTSTPGVRTSNSATMRSVSRRAAARSSRPSRPGRATGGRVWWPRIRFAHSGFEPRRPYRVRSSGMYPIPASRRASVPARLRSRPSSTIRPAVACRIPMIVSTSSVCPLPSTPAMPSTSPACTIRSTSASSGRPSSAASVRPSTRSTSRSVTVDSRVPGSGSSLPTIISASSRLVTVRGSAVPTLVPRRITVMLSAIARTSSSLCEMNRNV